MEIWSEIRREVLAGAFSKRAAIAKYMVGWHTLKKMLSHDALPGYRRAKQSPKPKLDVFPPLIRQMLEDDGKAPPNHKHTARRHCLNRSVARDKSVGNARRVRPGMTKPRSLTKELGRASSVNAPRHAGLPEGHGVPPVGATPLPPAHHAVCSPTLS